MLRNIVDKQKTNINDIVCDDILKEVYLQMLVEVPFP